MKEAIRRQQNVRKTKFEKFVDKSIYGFAVLGPLFTIPQIIKIFTEKTAAGLSATTWVAWMVIAIFWIIYGMYHKDKPIILMGFSWIAAELFVLVGIFMYG